MRMTPAERLQHLEDVKHGKVSMDAAVQHVKQTTKSRSGDRGAKMHEAPSVCGAGWGHVPNCVQVDRPTAFAPLSVTLRIHQPPG